MTNNSRKPVLDKFAYVGLEGSLISCLLDRVFRRKDQTSEQRMVLLVELETDVSAIIVAPLEREGYTVKQADNWRSWQSSEGSEDIPALVVTGDAAADLPEIACCVQLRHLPLIVIGQRERYPGWETIPVSAWMQLPISIVDFVVTVKTLLGDISDDVPAAFVDHF